MPSICIWCRLFCTKDEIYTNQFPQWLIDCYCSRLLWQRLGSCLLLFSHDLSTRPNTSPAEFTRKIHADDITQQKCIVGCAVMGEKNWCDKKSTAVRTESTHLSVRFLHIVELKQRFAHFVRSPSVFGVVLWLWVWLKRRKCIRNYEWKRIANRRSACIRIRRYALALASDIHINT